MLCNQGELDLGAHTHSDKYIIQHRNVLLVLCSHVDPPLHVCQESGGMVIQFVPKVGDPEVM